MLEKLTVKKNKTGFTLIEIMIAIFLIGVALVGVLAFFNSSLQSGFDAKNELIAAGLAQEEPEIIRNIAENTFLSGSGNWYDNIDKSNCKTADYISISDEKCKTVYKLDVCIDIHGRYYQCNHGAGGSATPFFRSVDIGIDTSGGADLDKGACFQVTSTVGWPSSDPNCKTDITQCPYKTQAFDIICKPTQ